MTRDTAWPTATAPKSTDWAGLQLAPSTTQKHSPGPAPEPLMGTSMVPAVASPERTWTKPVSLPPSTGVYVRLTVYVSPGRRTRHWLACTQLLKPSGSVVASGAQNSCDSTSRRTSRISRSPSPTFLIVTCLVELVSRVTLPNCTSGVSQPLVPHTWILPRPAVRPKRTSWRSGSSDFTTSSTRSGSLSAAA